MMTIAEMAASCRWPDREAERASRARWDSIAKPLHGLGLLEDAVVKICAVTGDPDCPLRPRGVAVFCADNGVVAQGVTQTGQEVTAIVAENMTRGETSVCKMAAQAGAEVFPVDMGMATRPGCPGLLDRRQGDGTADFTLGPAMSRAQAEACLWAGYRLARELAEKGYRLLAAGEMGIGNTTTSSAVASVLLREEPARWRCWPRWGALTSPPWRGSTWGPPPPGCRWCWTALSRRWRRYRPAGWPRRRGRG